MKMHHTGNNYNQYIVQYLQRNIKVIKLWKIVIEICKPEEKESQNCFNKNFQVKFLSPFLVEIFML